MTFLSSQGLSGPVRQHEKKNYENQLAGLGQTVGGVSVCGVLITVLFFLIFRHVILVW